LSFASRQEFDYIPFFIEVTLMNEMNWDCYSKKKSLSNPRTQRKNLVHFQFY
jgi:hypothetical protein